MIGHGGCYGATRYFFFPILAVSSSSLWSRNIVASDDAVMLEGIAAATARAFAAYAIACCAE